jgi:PAS domain S-box-containing protein
MRPGGFLEYLSERLIEYTGFREEECLRKWGFVHPDDRDRTRGAWQLAVSTIAPFQAEFRARSSKGEYRWMTARAEPVLGQGGEIMMWVGTWTDIDVFRRLEDELRLAKAREAASSATLEALQLTAPVGFALLDRDLRVVCINKIVAAVNGVSVEGAAGRPIAEIAPDAFARVEPSYRHVLDTGESISNLRVDRLDDAGRESRWQVSFFPVRVEQEVVGVGVAGIDITDRLGDDDFGSVLDLEAMPALNQLSDRQREVLTLLLRGERVPGIARTLFLAPSTVRNHLTDVFRKLGVHSQEELLHLFRADWRALFRRR